MFVSCAVDDLTWTMSKTVNTCSVRTLFFAKLWRVFLQCKIKSECISARLDTTLETYGISAIWFLNVHWHSHTRRNLNELKLNYEKNWILRIFCGRCGWVLIQLWMESTCLKCSYSGLSVTTILQKKVLFIYLFTFGLAYDEAYVVSFVLFCLLNKPHSKCAFLL